jgi:hypothetical protein
LGKANHSNIQLHTGANNNHMALQTFALDELQEQATLSIIAGALELPFL